MSKIIAKRYQPSGSWLGRTWDALRTCYENIGLRSVERADDADFLKELDHLRGK